MEDGYRQYIENVLPYLYEKKIEFEKHVKDGTVSANQTELIKLCSAYRKKLENTFKSLDERYHDP